MMEAGVSIGLQSTSEVLQVLPRMFSSAVFRISEPDRRGLLLACRSVVANIGPEPSGLGLAVAGREHWYGRVVGMKLAAGKHMLADGLNQRIEQITGGTNPSGHGRARDLDSLTGIDLRLPEQWEVICVMWCIT